MDALQLSVEDDDAFPMYPNRVRVVRMKVNGRDLLDAIREIELPYYKTLGHPEWAGGYVAPPLLEVAPPSKYFYGNNGWLHDADEGQPHAVSLYVCASCGSGSCSSWGAWIEVTPEAVTWSSIRNGDPRSASSNDPLGPFTFDRAAYDSEVGRLVGALEPMFQDRLAWISEVAKNPYLVTSDRWASFFASRPWGLAVRFEQDDGKGGLAKRGFGLWSADTEAEVLRRKKLAEDALGISG